MIQVIIADDHVIFRKGMQMILNRIDGVEVCGEVDNGKDCIELVARRKPDLIFMDIRMPGLNGIEATKIIHRDYPDIKIVALSMFGEEEYLAGMLEAGACGFILKDVDKSELSFAINQIMEGQGYFSRQLLPYFTNKFLEEKKHIDEIQLTPREIEVLKEIATGKSTQEIADALFISKRTVEGHRAHLIAKTESNNVIELVLYAIRHDLVDVK